MFKDIHIADFHTIGFDLDDTLHYFKKASSAAITETLLYISENCNLPAEQLHTDYQHILQNAQSTHFTEDKPAREYRRARFERLLEQHRISPHIYIESILDRYDTVLAQNLLLKEGAFEILRMAKEAGKKTIIITEGPQDAQALTIERLGLSPYIDTLITSAAYGTSKSEGLFEIALREIGCPPSDMLYIGDSLDRDYAPANGLGIPCLLLRENDNFEGGANRIKSLKELAPLFYPQKPAQNH
jgi:putative hydrolase of the HAD superfamily